MTMHKSQYKNHYFNIGNIVKISPLGELRLYEYDDIVILPHDIGIIYELIDHERYKVHMQIHNKTLMLHESEVLEIKHK